MAETNKECSTRQMASIVVATCLQKAIWGCMTMVRRLASAGGSKQSRLAEPGQAQPPASPPGPAASRPSRRGWPGRLIPYVKTTRTN